MSWLEVIAGKVFGLFVDSGAFAIAILVWIAVVGLTRARFGNSSAYAGAVLFGGLAAILLESVLRQARRR